MTENQNDPVDQMQAAMKFFVEMQKPAQEAMKLFADTQMKFFADAQRPAQEAMKAFAELQKPALETPVSSRATVAAITYLVQCRASFAGKGLP